MLKTHRSHYKSADHMLIVLWKHFQFKTNFFFSSRSSRYQLCSLLSVFTFPRQANVKKRQDYIGICFMMWKSNFIQTFPFEKRGFDINAITFLCVMDFISENIKLFCLTCNDIFWDSESRIFLNLRLYVFKGNEFFGGQGLISILLDPQILSFFS